MQYKLYHKDELIAVSENKPEVRLRLKDGVENYPITLFGFGRYKRDTASEMDIARWGSMRVCPPNREGIENILKSHKLSKYDQKELLRLNQYRTMHDDFWMVVE